jgi:hypothetical protein
MPLSTPKPSPGPFSDPSKAQRGGEAEGVFLRFLRNLQATALPSEALPQPYRDLLAHERDMTSTLTRHHGERMALRVLELEISANRLERRVHLLAAETRRVVEVGAIRIQLSLFPPQAHQQIREGLCPLGAVLAEHRIPYLSQPQGFFRVESVTNLGLASGLPASRQGAPPEPLAFGRHNILLSPTGELLAEVLELLPT